MSSSVGEKHPLPNFWPLYGSVFAFFAFHTWPQAGGYFAWYVLSGFLTLIALGSALKTIDALRRDYMRRKLYAQARQSSGVFGSARFSNVSELKEAKMLDPSGPMFLGLSHHGLPVFLPRQYHLAVQAPPGSGKTSRLVGAGIMHAARTGRSCFVSDCKEELAHLWAPELRRLGYRVVINNPARLDSFPHDGDANPFQVLVDHVADLSPDSQSEVMVIAEGLARSLIPEIKSDKDFFRAMDRDALVFASVALAGFTVDQCYPSQIYLTLKDENRFADLCHRAMEKPDILSGELMAYASSFLAKKEQNPEHYEGALSGSSNALSVFKPSSKLGSVGASNDFDPVSMRDPDKPPVIVFDVMPADKLKVYGKAMGLIQTSRLHAVKRVRGRDIVWFADEASNSPIPSVVEEIELARGFGITMTLFYQSWSSMERVYGKEQAESIRASSVEIYMAVGNLKTAEEISKRFGDHTVKTNSQSFDEHGKPGQNFSEAKQAFLPIDEVLSMPKGWAVAFMPDLRPVSLETIPWFEMQPFKSVAGENPLEQHPPSKITRLTFEYGKDASELGPPRIPDMEQRAARAAKAEQVKTAPVHVPLVPMRSLTWIPILIACGLFIQISGTPHVLFEYEIRANKNAVHACTYVGLSGIRPLSIVGECPAIKFVTYQPEGYG